MREEQERNEKNKKDAEEAAKKKEVDWAGPQSYPVANGCARQIETIPIFT